MELPELSTEDCQLTLSGALPTIGDGNATGPSAVVFSPYQTMDHQKFDEAIRDVLARDSRFDRAAYYFLRDALDYTLKLRKKATGAQGHITGQQLLEGLRQHALKTFGPMVPTVFEYWGVRSAADFGVMVFSLVESGIFGKTDSDSLDDFKNVYTFHDAFVAPFIPHTPAAPVRKVAVGTPARELN